MAAASVWSLYTTAQVNRQLATLAQSLIPLTATLDTLGDELLRQNHLVDRAVISGDAAEHTAQEFVGRAAAIDRLIQQASDLVALGSRIAVLDRNRLEFARLSPVLAQINHQHGRYRAHAEQLLSAMKAAERPVPAALRALLAEDNEEMSRLVSLVIDELHGFVGSIARTVEANERQALHANLLLIAAAALVGLVLALVVTRGMVVPLRRLRLGTQAVEAGRLDSEVPVTSRDEIGDVTRAFNRMVVELRAKERIKETFGQYVDPRVVSSLLEGRAAQVSGGEKQIVTVFFSDIAGFTSLGERLTPGGLVTLINEYFTVMSRPIRARSGIIDKYIGDSVMAFWAPPFAAPGDQAALACAAALEQFEQLAEFRMRIPDLIGLRQGVPHFDMRVGLASGEAIVGSIGSEFSRGFTVMGDTVNLGSRLEGANKAYGTHILIDATTRDMAGDAIETREVDSIAVVGKSEPVRIHELLALKGGLDPVVAELRDQFAVALTAYRAGDWSSASSGFQACLDLRPDDKPSRTMLARTTTLAAAPPPNWDGVWRFTSK